MQFIKAILAHSIIGTVALILPQSPADAINPRATAAEAIRTFLEIGIDSSIKPCNDFYKYSCGKFGDDLRERGWSWDSSKQHHNHSTINQFLYRRDMVMDDLARKLYRIYDDVNNWHRYDNLTLNLALLHHQCIEGHGDRSKKAAK